MFNFKMPSPIGAPGGYSFGGNSYSMPSNVQMPTPIDPAARSQGQFGSFRDSLMSGMKNSPLASNPFSLMALPFFSMMGQMPQVQRNQGLNDRIMQVLGRQPNG